MISWPILSPLQSLSNRFPDQIRKLHDFMTDVLCSPNLLCIRYAEWCSFRRFKPESLSKSKRFWSLSADRLYFDHNNCRATISFEPVLRNAWRGAWDGPANAPHNHDCQWRYAVCWRYADGSTDRCALPSIPRRANPSLNFLHGNRSVPLTVTSCASNWPKTLGPIWGRPTYLGTAHLRVSCLLN